MSSNKSDVLVVTDAEETTQAISTVLDSSSRFALGDVCRNLHDLVDHMERNPSAAVLVDIDPEPTRMLGDLDPIIRRFSDTRFIVLSDTGQEDLVFEAMHVGARHFMVKQSIGSQLDSALHRLVRNGSVVRAQGRMITVLSASGGCGGTTVAVNLANELQLASSKSALVVDLDCCYGAVATHLGLHGEYGIADLLARERELDPQLIRSTALVSSKNLHVLISPATTDPVSPAPLAYSRLGHAVSALKDAYKYTVIDAPRVPTEVAADLINRSDVTLLVLQLTVKDLKVMRALLSGLKAQGVQTHRVLALVNRYRKRVSPITLADAERALDGLTIRCMSNDYRSAIDSLNFGRLLDQAAPRSVLRRELKQLAAEIVMAEATGSNGRRAR